MKTGGRHASGVAYYVFAFMLLSSMLIVAAILAGLFWLSRPVNMVPATNRMASVLESVLRDNFVPAGNIERGEPVEQSTERDGITTRWSAVDFTVILPPELNPDGLKAQIQDTMGAHFVRVTDQERDSASEYKRLAFYLDDLPFAHLTLVPETRPKTTTVARSDLRNSSTQLANLVDSVLTTLPPETRFERGPADEREDAEARWNYTDFSVSLPAGLTPGALKARLEEAGDALPNVTIETSPVRGPETTLLLRLAGKVCVGVACTVTDAPAPEPPDVWPPSLESLLSGGIMGSEPDESGPTSMPAEPEAVSQEAPMAAVTPPTAVSQEEPPAAVARRSAIRPPVPRSSAGGAAAPGSAVQIAIIIDDGGYSSAQADQYLALDSRLTLAILPGTTFGASIAERGAALGFEIMLHMPMEPENGAAGGVPGTVLTEMDQAEIRALTNAALDQIPFVMGVNNHTGSKFTSNRKKMEIVLDVLKERGLYFVDSVTMHTSVAYSAAVELGVRAGRRDVFLDHNGGVAAVRAQFEVLKQMARAKGSAIGIGHFQSAATAAVLAEEIPKLAAENILLVHASELVQ